MKILFHRLLLFLFILPGVARAQKKEAITRYIDEYKVLAIEEMKRTGVPAAITLAQGIHESGAGNSQLASQSNNHFGIKCKSNWTGETVTHDDDTKGECFRKYPSVADSYRDHSDFLKNGARYGFLFSLDPANYTEWANGLKKAGYATNPKYPDVLIKLIEDYDLQEYSLIAMGKINDPFITAASVETTENPGPSPVTDLKPEINYPTGEFKINDTKVVYVKKGVSYLSVAKQYDLDLSKIFEFNEMNPAEAVAEDQLIYLQRKRKTGYNEFHIVQPGETLRDIAQQEAIRTESLKSLNWLKEDEHPAPGEKLNLKTKSLSMPKLSLRENFSLTSPGLNRGQ